MAAWNYQAWSIPKGRFEVPHFVISNRVACVSYAVSKPVRQHGLGIWIEIPSPIPSNVILETVRYSQYKSDLRMKRRHVFTTWVLVDSDYFGGKWCNDDKINANKTWWRHQMETFFAFYGNLWREFTGPRWIRRTKASDAELWCFFYLRLNRWLCKQSWGLW